eukprot:282792-Rhodomonas_salina.2
MAPPASGMSGSEDFAGGQHSRAGCVEMAVKPSAPEQVATEEASATSWVPKGRTSSSRDLPATQSAQHIAESEAEVSTRRPLCVRFWER